MITEEAEEIKEVEAEEPEAFEIKTSCRDCEFATWGVTYPHKDGDKEEQSGCLADRLRKFGVAERHEDDEKIYFVIPNRLCNMCRNHEWAEQFQDKEVDLYEIARNEIKLKFDVLYLIDNHHTMGDIQNIIDYVNALDFKPTRVYIADLRDGDAKTSDIVVRFRNLETLWSVRKVVEDAYKNNKNALINHLMNDSRAQFWMVSDIVSRQELLLGKLADHFINEECQRFLMITLKSGTIFVQHKLTKDIFLEFGYDVDLQAKIKEFVEQQNLPDYILDGDALIHV